MAGEREKDGGRRETASDFTAVFSNQFSVLSLWLLVVSKLPTPK
jgi:hypothetical protein